MTEPLLRRLAVLLVLLGLAACSAVPPPPPPALLEEMRELDRQALRALRENRLSRAVSLYGTLLKRQQSIENLSGIAVSSINLASVLHRLRQDDEAVRLLQAVADNRDGVFPAAAASEAAFRLAVVRLDSNHPDLAAALLAQARSGCAAPCGLRAAFDNLQARLLLVGGQSAAALALVDKNTEDASAEEMANRSRLQASALAALGRDTEALERWQQTLERDKGLAQSRHILEDLEQIAVLLERRGDAEGTAVYRRRATAVRESLAPVE